MPVFHSGYLSKTGRPDLNLPLRPMTRNLTQPLAPRNQMVTSPYQIGKTDIRWDNPKVIPQNNDLQLVGCNVYRCTDSPYGTYIKVNTSPIQVLFYRDQTKEVYVSEEMVTSTLIGGTDPTGKWMVYSQMKPLIIPGTNGQYTTRVQDVKVEIDNGDGIFLEVPAFAVNGILGEITLISDPIYNYDVKQIIPPRLPYPPSGRVRISYTYLNHSVLSVISQRIYYKVTTVAVDPEDPMATIETPLDEIEAHSSFDMEALDWVWTEAIRRNQWILDQGGERVMVYVRKWMGEVCKTYEHDYGQSSSCEQCLGTGIVGGYDGPYYITIAPPETEKMIELMDMGLHVRYDWMSWVGPYPLLNQRDLIIRSNNERYLVGPVNPQGSRGAIYQQHFTISYIDEGDIRYKVEVTGGADSVPASTNLYREDRKSPASPVIPVKPEIDLDKIIKSRTVTFENITF